MKHHSLFQGYLAVTILTTAAFAHAATLYTVMELGTLGGTSSGFAQGINNNGDVAAWGCTNSGFCNALLLDRVAPTTAVPALGSLALIGRGLLGIATVRRQAIKNAS